VYLNRRSFIKSIGLSAGSAALTSIPFINHARSNEENKVTSYKDITTYNNYYELGLLKVTPISIHSNLKLHPGQ
jgi:sulfoxide reductase catalytic subunit YedY